MTPTTKPPKQAVRDWMNQRAEEDDAPPSNEEIRRQLGWHLLRNPPDQKRDDD